MRRTLLAFASVIAIAAIASVATAQQAAQPTAEQRERARAAYARGQQEFQAGNFSAAESAFMEAYATIPNAIVQVGIAEARERLGNIPGTVEALEQYLRDRPSAPDRATIEARIQQLRARPAQLYVTTDPPGATVRVDGTEQGEVTPIEIEVTPGEHEIELSLDRHATNTQTVSATFGTRREVNATLEPEALPTRADTDVTTPPPESEGDEGDEAPPPSVTPGVIVATSIAGVGLVVGTVLGFLALSKQSDFDDMPSEELADDGERLALFADVSFGVAAAAGITAIVLFATGGERDDDTGTTTALRVTPHVGTQGGGVSARVSF